MSADLWEQATALPALLRAAVRAAAGKRDSVEVARFLMDRERLCSRLQRALRDGTWTPGVPRTFRLLDPKPRTITVLPFLDRVVHHALCAVAEPCFERFAITDSYACRLGKGQHAALRRAQVFARAAPWAWKGDIAAFFASIPHDRLLDLLQRRLPCAALCACFARIIRAAATAPGRGLPIGSLTSQHLANLYLGVLDHHLKDNLGARRYLRYMDDFIVFGEPAQVRALRDAAAVFLRERLGLALSAQGSAVLPVRDGVPWLGFRVYPGLLRVRSARLRRFRREARRITKALERGALSEEQAAAIQTSRYAHLAVAVTQQIHGSQLERTQPGLSMGADRSRSQARVPRRLLLERGPECPGRQPQQEHARQPQRQPGVSGGEHNTAILIAGASAPRSSIAGISGPEGPGSWIRPPRQGVDQDCVQRPGGGLIPGGTEAPRPGGGLVRGVVAGPPILALRRA